MIPSLFHEQLGVECICEFGADALEQRRRIHFVKQVCAADPEFIALLAVYQVSILRDPVTMNRAVKQLARHRFTSEPVPEHRVEQCLGQQARDIQCSLGLDGAQTGLKLFSHVQGCNLNEFAGFEGQFRDPVGEMAGQLL